MGQLEVAEGTNLNSPLPDTTNEQATQNTFKQTLIKSRTPNMAPNAVNGMMLNHHEPESEPPYLFSKQNHSALSSHNGGHNRKVVQGGPLVPRRLDLTKEELKDDESSIRDEERLDNNSAGEES